MGDLLLGWLQDLEGADQVFVDAHQGTRVVELSTVVGCGEDGDQLPFCEEFVALLDHLMGAADQVEVVLLAKDLHVVWSEGKGHSSFVLSPSLRIFVRIRPQQIAQQARIRHIRRLLYLLDLVNRIQLR